MSMRRCFTFAPLLTAAILISSCCGDSPTATGQTARDGEFLPTAPPGKKWELVWSDEFDAEELDRTLWETPVGPRRDGNWTAEDSYLDGQGNLVLRTRKDENGEFHSGAIRTRGTFEHAFGYWVARCKFHKEKGHWPAFWLFTPAVSKVGNGGRDGTEIDIMEKPWPVEDRINHALHWDGYGEHHESEGTQVVVPGLSEGWHTCALHWKPDEYVFYVDGEVTWRTATSGGVSQVPSYVKLTDEVGDWAGDIREADLPDYFYVDYVRVYDLVDTGTQ